MKRPARPRRARPPCRTRPGRRQPDGDDLLPHVLEQPPELSRHAGPQQLPHEKLCNAPRKLALNEWLTLFTALQSQ